ncbi:DUF2846 domain-containing protein [Halopseudomonas pachastrellae]|nr:DUF2846 domain-containing protein [Halopseudomonas pachastrellae]
MPRQWPQLRQHQQGAQRHEHRAKQFNTHPDYAQVYVYRNETFGAALSMPVSVDGRQAGTTGAKSFFRFQLEPGQHTISSQNGASSLLLNTEANRNYFVWQEVKWAWSPVAPSCRLSASNRAAPAFSSAP